MKDDSTRNYIGIEGDLDLYDLFKHKKYDELIKCFDSIEKNLNNFVDEDPQVRSKVFAQYLHLEKSILEFCQAGFENNPEANAIFALSKLLEKIYRLDMIRYKSTREEQYKAEYVELSCKFEVLDNLLQFLEENGLVSEAKLKEYLSISDNNFKQMSIYLIRYSKILMNTSIDSDVYYRLTDYGRGLYQYSIASKK